MKRMVKNGDLLDVEPDGTITVDGKSINAIEANPTDEATETLTKLKVGETTYGIEGGGGGGTTESVVITNPSTNRAITLSAGYDSRSYFCDTFNINTGGDKTLGINLYGKTMLTKIRFDKVSYNKYLTINGNDIQKEYLYISASRSAIPDVPTSNGTYILKAVVSGDRLTYSWELQA